MALRMSSVNFMKRICSIQASRLPGPYTTADLKQIKSSLDELLRRELRLNDATRVNKFLIKEKQDMRNNFSRHMRNVRSMTQLGDLGSGAGKGGGGGGAIRSAGGSFGKMEAAREEEYFYKEQKQQLEKLKGALHDEIGFHEEQIKRHQEAINRTKNQIGTLHKE